MKFLRLMPGKGEVVLWPEQYKAGEPVLPYSAVKH